MIYKSFVLFLLFFYSACTYSETTFTYREKESVNDSRYEYDRLLLELALKKTEDKYGPYKLVASKMGATELRSIMAAETGVYENFFVKQSVTPELVKNLAYIPFPVDRGIVGYRVAFIAEKNKEKIAKIKTLEQLKMLSILQGVGWFDIKILEHQGFKILSSGYYESMFNMVARGRADLFIRGANELLDEWESHKKIEGLAYDQTIVIHYPMPRFFFTNKANTEAIKRVSEGIIAAYNDGSLVKLWKEQYQESIDFSSLRNRRIFELENPFLNDVDPSYIQYNYDPFKPDEEKME
jgi:hypothetical protein